VNRNWAYSFAVPSVIYWLVAATAVMWLAPNDFLPALGISVPGYLVLTFLFLRNKSSVMR